MDLITISLVVSIGSLYLLAAFLMGYLKSAEIPIQQAKCIEHRIEPGRLYGEIPCFVVCEAREDGAGSLIDVRKWAFRDYDEAERFMYRLEDNCMEVLE